MIIMTVEKKISSGVLKNDVFVSRDTQVYGGSPEGGKSSQIEQQVRCQTYITVPAPPLPPSVGSLAFTRIAVPFLTVSAESHTHTHTTLPLPHFPTLPMITLLPQGAPIAIQLTLDDGSSTELWEYVDGEWTSVGEQLSG